MGLCQAPNYGAPDEAGEIQFVSQTRGNAKYRTFFNPELRQLPCGTCPACRSYHAKSWSLRAQLHAMSLTRPGETPDACFITLTYRDEELPDKGWTNRPDFNDFIKNVKDEYPLAHTSYLGCSEYGANGSRRPHYHLILYGHTFPKWRTPRASRKDIPAFNQAEIFDLWGKGRIELSDVEDAARAAKYVAGYLLKNQGHDEWTISQSKWEKQFITAIKPYSDKIILKEVERLVGPPDPSIHVSKQPAIAHNYFRHNLESIYKDDAIHLAGLGRAGLKGIRPPRSCDRICEAEAPKLWEQTLESRKAYRESNAIPMASDAELKSRQIIWDATGKQGQRFTRNSI